MTTFEQEFPSLKDKLEDIGSSWSGIVKEDIMEYCLDKQRVREALYRISAASGMAAEAVQKEKKELGL